MSVFVAEVELAVLQLDVPGDALEFDLRHLFLLPDIPGVQVVVCIGVEDIFVFDFNVVDFAVVSGQVHDELSFSTSQSLMILDAPALTAQSRMFFRQ